MSDFVNYVSPNNFITIELLHFPSGAKPIRWDNQGLVGYVGVDKVANMLDDLRDQAKRDTLNRPASIRVWWSEVMSSIETEVLEDSTDSTCESNPDSPE